MSALAKLSLHMAAICSVAASLAHFWVIVSGPSAYALLGAPPEVVASAEAGTLYAPLVTAGIATVIFGWAIYAWSGLGVLPKMPLLRTGLIAVAAVLLVRAFGGFLLVYLNGLSPSGFGMWSSLICAALGALYLYGTVSGWKNLGIKT